MIEIFYGNRFIGLDGEFGVGGSEFDYLRQTIVTLKGNSIWQKRRTIKSNVYVW